jgi:DNA-binding winged helix-turn-helix (wHTH) protein/predicted ATPase
VIYVFEGDYTLDPQRYELRRAGEPIKLEPQVFNVLLYLVQHRERVVTKEELLERLWTGRVVGDATLTSRIKAVRRAVGDGGRQQRVIQTSHGRGYRFIATVIECQTPGPGGETETQTALTPAARAAEARRPPRSLENGLTPKMSPDVALPLTSSSPASLRAVGRDAELAQLRNWLQQALAGTRQVVFVGGEAGLGKTTLVEAFLQSLGEYGALWLGRGQCLEHYGSGEAYMPVLEALGRLCRGPEGQVLLGLLVRQAPTWVVQMSWLLDDRLLETLQRRTIGATRQRMLREMAEALEVLTAEHPLVLILEDLHWSDASTLDLIALLARRREPARLFLLSTYRPVEAMRSDHPLQAMKQELHMHGQCHELGLRLLTDTEVAMYLTTRFPGVEFPPEMKCFLHRRTDGNPLFMVNVVEYWQAQGLPVEPEEPAHLSSWFAALEETVPDTLRKMIEQQFAELGVDERRLLEAASVVGKEFAAAAVAPGVDRPTEDVEATLDRLARRRQFLRPHAIAEWPDGTVASTYAFIHDLYREVFYDRIPAAQRVRWHRQVGLRLEAGYADRAPEVAVELASHFIRGRDVRRAVHYLRSAGDTALRRSAYYEASAHLGRALDLLPELPDTADRAAQELHLQVALGAALTANKGFAAPEAGRAYTRARDLARQVKDTPRRAPVLLGLWLYYHVRAELHTARQIGEDLLRLARTGNDPLLLHQAHHALGITLTDLGAFADALRHLERAVSLYTPELHRVHVEGSVYDTGVICRVFAAHNLWALGQPEQAAQYTAEALALAETLDHPYTSAGVLCLATVVGAWRREWPRVQAWAAAAVALSREQGFPYFLAWGMLMQGRALSAQGQSHEGLILLRQGLADYRATGASVLQTYWAVLLAEALGEAGDVEMGLEVIDEALATVAHSGEERSAAELYRLRGELLQRVEASKRPVEVTPEVCFQQSLALACRQQARSLELRAAMSLSRLWQRQGKGREARQLLASVYDRFSEGFASHDLQETESLLAELAS